MGVTYQQYPNLSPKDTYPVFSLAGPKAPGWVHVGQVLIGTSRANPSEWEATINGQVLGAWTGPVSPQFIVQAGEVLKVSSPEGLLNYLSAGWPQATTVTFIGITDTLASAPLNMPNTIPPLVPVPSVSYVVSSSQTAVGNYTLSITTGVYWQPTRVEVYTPAGAAKFSLTAETVAGAANGNPLVQDFTTTTAPTIIPLTSKALITSAYSYINFDVISLAGTSPTIDVTIYYDTISEYNPPS